MIVVIGYAVFMEGVVFGYPNMHASLPLVLRVGLGLPFVLFLPGYALLTVLYPAERPAGAGTKRWGSLRGNGLQTVDRAALSFGASIAMVPLLGLLMAGLGVTYSPGTIVSVLAVTIVAGMALGAVRRLSLPESERFHVPVGRWVDELTAATVHADDSHVGALNAAVIVLAVVAVVGLGLAFAAPPAAESYTEFALLTENAQGDLVSSGFPDTLVAGAQTQLVIGMENNEGERTTYTVVGELQRVETDGGEVAVLERARIDEFQRTLEPGESIRDTRTVAPELVGEDLRLVYYLYTGDEAGNPDDAYRTVYIWVTVREA